MKDKIIKAHTEKSATAQILNLRTIFTSNGKDLDRVKSDLQSYVASTPVQRLCDSGIRLHAQAMAEFAYNNLMKKDYADEMDILMSNIFFDALGSCRFKNGYYLQNRYMVGKKATIMSELTAIFEQVLTDLSRNQYKLDNGRLVSFYRTSLLNGKYGITSDDSHSYNNGTIQYLLDYYGFTQGIYERASGDNGENGKCNTFFITDKINKIRSNKFELAELSKADKDFNAKLLDGNFDFIRKGDDNIKEWWDVFSSLVSLVTFDATDKDYKDALQIAYDVNASKDEKKAAHIIIALVECDLQYLFQATIDAFSGRFHTKLTQLESSIRERLITKSGEKAVEIDMVNTQPTLLSYLCSKEIGHKVKSFYLCLQGKFYEQFANFLGVSENEITNVKSVRKLAKNKTMYYLNGRNCFNDLKPGDHYSRNLFNYLRDNDSEFFDWIDDHKRKEHHILSNGRMINPLSKKGQSFEVDLFSHIQSELSKLGYTLTTIHDCVLIPFNIYNEVYSFINNYILDRTGVEVLLK